MRSNHEVLKCASLIQSNRDGHRAGPPGVHRPERTAPARFHFHVLASRSTPAGRMEGKTAGLELSSERMAMVAIPVMSHANGANEEVPTPTPERHLHPSRVHQAAGSAALQRRRCRQPGPETTLECRCVAEQLLCNSVRCESVNRE